MTDHSPYDRNREDYRYSSLYTLGKEFPDVSRLRRQDCYILILLICESIGLLSQLFLGKNRLNNDVHKENAQTLLFRSRDTQYICILEK